MPFYTLGDLYEKVAFNPRGRVLAIVTDSSAPYRKGLNKKFILKVKVIDRSLCQSSSCSCPRRYCTIFFFTKLLTETPKLCNVGDILLLDNFEFQLWNNEFQGSSISDCSWAVFSGDKNADTAPFQQSRLFNSDLIGPLLKEQIRSLRQFAFNYFSQFSLNLVQYNQSSQGDFDAILKLQSCTDQESRYRLAFTDGERQFFMISQQGITPGIYKIRGIARLNWQGKGGQLIANDYTWMMRILDSMKSSNEIGKGLPASPERLQPPKQISQSALLKTIISEEFRQIPAVTLSELVSKQSTGPSLITCWITDIPIRSISKGLKKLIDCRLIQPFESRLGEFIYQVPFTIQDNSMNERGVQVFLFSFDGKGQDFFPRINPKQIFGHQIIREEKIFEEYKNRLMQETSAEKPLQLCVQPIFSQGRVIYRIIECQLQE